MKIQGIGIGGLLCLIFLTLKLTGIGAVASWSWWWIMAPLWIPAALVGIILLIIGLVVLASKL